MNVEQDQRTTSFLEQGLCADAMRLWGMECRREHREIALAGSPERSAFRTVVESISGGRFILEQVFAADVERKKMIAGNLDALAVSGLETVIPYCKDRHGAHVLPFAGRFWQLHPFLPGIEPDRPEYVFEGWRGTAAAGFLTDLRRCSDALPTAGRPEFKIKGYIYRLLGDVQRRDPAFYDRIRGAADFLERDFFAVSDHLPSAFCHGDYHPLNILWTPCGVGAVIDWEFCGDKAEMYDAANMVGCLGIEDPQALAGDCVGLFLESLKSAGIFRQESWRYFYDLILAVRFGWMAEWLRKKDQEMVAMELDYWDIIIEHKTGLQTVWGL